MEFKSPSKKSNKQNIQFVLFANWMMVGEIMVITQKIPPKLLLLIYLMLLKKEHLMENQNTRYYVSLNILYVYFTLNKKSKRNYIKIILGIFE